MRILKWGCGTLLALLAVLFILAVALGPAPSTPSTSPRGPRKEVPKAEVADVEVPIAREESRDAARDKMPLGDLDRADSQAPQEKNAMDQSDPYSDAAKRESERLREIDQYPDLFIVLSRASAGEQDLDALKGSYVQGNEAFQVESVLDGFVLYQLRPDLQSLGNRRSVALMRDPHKSYVTGDLMPRDIYTLRGTGEFETVFGAHEMIPLIERGKK